MARKNGDWKTFARGLVTELQSRPKVTMTVEQIKEGTKTTMTVEALQDRGYWNACRKGSKGTSTLKRTPGWRLQEHLDSRGKVVAVTYRLAEAQAAACR